MKQVSDQSYGIIPVKLTPEPTFLLIQHNGGHWGFPKGHPEPQETPLESALRELREETGVSSCEIIDNAPISEYYEFEQNGVMIRKSVDYFIGIVANDAVVTIQEDEISGFRWATAAQAEDIVTHRATMELIAETLNRLAK